MILKQKKPLPQIVQNVNLNISGTAEIEKAEAPSVTIEQAKALPRLVDLGADKCIPCKMMAPLLVELRSEYEGTLKVEFIDVWKNPDEAPKYGIKLIPTQIFFDASGKELFRHEGFYSKEDILAKWTELGVELTKTK
ncbi:MAG: thioredoxin family protein [Planctomycetes bacterium]|nr:thioredoxin family protein [Planctomycetota bacterium]